MRVVITNAAREDLTGIGEFIAVDSPRRAATFVDELLDRCEQLAELSSAFPLVQTFEARGVRRCRHRDYLIFYRIEQDVVSVLHILHGVVDYEERLRRETR